MPRPSAPAAGSTLTASRGLTAGAYCIHYPQHPHLQLWVHIHSSHTPSASKETGWLVGWLDTFVYLAEMINFDP